MIAGERHEPALSVQGEYVVVVREQTLQRPTANLRGHVLGRVGEPRLGREAVALEPRTFVRDQIAALPGDAQQRRTFGRWHRCGARGREDRCELQRRFGQRAFGPFARRSRHPEADDEQRLCSEILRRSGHDRLKPGGSSERSPREQLGDGRVALGHRRWFRARDRRALIGRRVGPALLDRCHRFRRRHGRARCREQEPRARTPHGGLPDARRQTLGPSLPASASSQPMFRLRASSTALCASSAARARAAPSVCPARKRAYS